MATTLEKPPISIRDLMPEGYLSQLMDRTGSKSYSNLAQIVRTQHHTSKYWPAVLALAQETNPAGYAAWVAANPDKLSARPVAVAEPALPAAGAPLTQQPALAQAA